MTGANGTHPEPPEYRPWNWLCTAGHWTETNVGAMPTGDCCPHCPRGVPCRQPVTRVDVNGKRIGERATTKNRRKE